MLLSAGPHWSRFSSKVIFVFKFPFKSLNGNAKLQMGFLNYQTKQGIPVSYLCFISTYLICLWKEAGSLSANSGLIIR
jgi:hypothetical protein